MQGYQIFTRRRRRQSNLSGIKRPRSLTLVPVTSEMKWHHPFLQSCLQKTHVSIPIPHATGFFKCIVDGISSKSFIRIKDFGQRLRSIAGQYARKKNRIV